MHMKLWQDTVLQAGVFQIAIPLMVGPSGNFQDLNLLAGWST